MICRVRSARPYRQDSMRYPANDGCQPTSPDFSPGPPTPRTTLTATRARQGGGATAEDGVMLATTERPSPARALLRRLVGGQFKRRHFAGRRRDTGGGNRGGLAVLGDHQRASCPCLGRIGD